MNRPDPGFPWFAGLGLWCRLWQMQLDHSMRLWAAWAGAMPRPIAADLSAEAERQRLRGDEPPPMPRRVSRGAPQPEAPRPPEPVLH